MAQATSFLVFSFAIGMFLLVEYASWNYSGWRRLQSDFRSNATPIGRRFRSVSGSMGEGWFQKSINCGCNEVGIFFWQSDIFDGFFHRKLLIPWSYVRDLTVENGEIASFSVQGVRITLISKYLVEWLQSNHGKTLLFPPSLKTP